MTPGPRVQHAITARYGSAWQELRAHVAISLIGWALSIHHPAAIDTARGLAEIVDEAEREAAA